MSRMDLALVCEEMLSLLRDHEVLGGVNTSTPSNRRPAIRLQR